MTGIDPKADSLHFAINVHIEFYKGELTPSEQSLVLAGFHTHSEEQSAPEYKKERVKWLAFDERKQLRAILTAEILWDWVYIDELWISQDCRGKGLGRKLMQLAEEFARSQSLQGLWLWTQSWQAEGFYERLGYDQFTRFDSFPKGYSRVGFRKTLA